MDERPRTGVQPRSTPGSAEIVGYGLLAAAVAAGVLYLDGQRARDIAVITGGILALLATLVLIAPRLRVPERELPEREVPEREVPERESAGRIRRDEPPAAASETAHHDVRRAPEHAGIEQPATETSPESHEMSAGSAGNTTAGYPASGRRAKRGRRRR